MYNKMRTLFTVSVAFMIFFNASAEAVVNKIEDKHKTILTFDANSLIEKSLDSALKTASKKGSTALTGANQSEIKSWPAGPVTTAWTKLELNMFVKHKATPSRAARALALTHVAMHDALVVTRSIDIAPDKTRSASRIRPSQNAAVAGAAASVLGYIFPSEQGYFDQLARDVCQIYLRQGTATPQELEAGFQIGKAVGEIATVYGQSDGAARGWNGEKLIWHGEGRPFGPGFWEPTPPYNYYPPDEPYAPYWKTWVLERADQVRPEPPAYGSARYMRDLQEVKDIREHLTDEQQRIAKFWVDGSGTVTPAGHWNRIALDLVEQYKPDDMTTASIFAYLNMALIDAQISAWDAKYAYWTVRPVTAIRAIYNTNFDSYILTPPFPSYFSGHAAFSGAGSEFLAQVFPKDAQHLRAMGEEAAMSRLYGGIHYRFDNEDGLMVGRKISQLAFDKIARNH